MNRITRTVLSRIVPKTVPRRPLSVSVPKLHGDFEWEDPKSPEDIVNVGTSCYFKSNVNFCLMTGFHASNKRVKIRHKYFMAFREDSDNDRS